MNPSLLLVEPRILCKRNDFGFVWLPPSSIDNDGNQTKPKSLLCTRPVGLNRNVMFILFLNSTKLMLNMCKCPDSSLAMLLSQ